MQSNSASVRREGKVACAKPRVRSFAAFEKNAISSLPSQCQNWSKEHVFMQCCCREDKRGTSGRLSPKWVLKFDLSAASSSSSSFRLNNRRSLTRKSVLQLLTNNRNTESCMSAAGSANLHICHTFHYPSPRCCFDIHVSEPKVLLLFSRSLTTKGSTVLFMLYSCYVVVATMGRNTSRHQCDQLSKSLTFRVKGELHCWHRCVPQHAGA